LGIGVHHYHRKATIPPKLTLSLLSQTLQRKNKDIFLNQILKASAKPE
jgi:hypothetical protein